jgi:hypothetical protein
MMRPSRFVAGLVLAGAGAVSLAVVVAAPRPKDSPPGAPMTAEQIRAALKDKGSITYADGQYRLSVGRIDGTDLVDLEFRTIEDGKVVYQLTSPRALIVSVDSEAGTMRLRFGRMKVVRGEVEIEAVHQEHEFQAPRQGKRP